MRKRIVFFISLLVIASCNTKTQVEIPPNVMPKEKMAEVMVDVSIFESISNMQGMNAGNSALNGLPSVKNWNLLEAHKITKKQFDESFEFYSANPELLNEVFQLVLIELSKKQAETNIKK